MGAKFEANATEKSSAPVPGGRHFQKARVDRVTSFSPRHEVDLPAEVVSNWGGEGKAHNQAIIDNLVRNDWLEP